MICHKCQKIFPRRVKINGLIKVLSSRKYCLECSPWGQHLTRPLDKNRSRYTDEPDEVFISAIKKSISIAGAINLLNRAIVGSNYRYIKKRILSMGLDISHWKGQAHGTTKFHPIVYGPEKVLVQFSAYSRRLVRDIILRNKLLPYKCAICNLDPLWNNKPLTLRLDHINGVRNDHRLQNLRFLCPNCDSQTETFCGRNKKQNSQFSLLKEKGKET